MTPEQISQIKVGGKYNWKNQPERLFFLGKTKDHPRCRGWYQFALVTKPNEVWCDVREEDLSMFEETL